MIAFLVGVIVACGDDDGDHRSTDAAIAEGDADLDAGVTGRTELGAGEFVAEFVRAACELYIGCRAPASDGQEIRLLLGDEQRCRETWGQSLAAQLQPLLAGVEEGLLNYDPVAALRCVEHLPSGCMAFEADHPLRAFRSVCEDVFEGVTVEGEPCRQDLECAGLAYCEQAQLTCGGVCAPRRPRGTACDAREQCAAPEGIAAWCELGRCVELFADHVLAEAGEPCRMLGPDPDLKSIRNCAAGLWCNTNFDTELGTCEPQRTIGSACLESDVCEDGAVCMQVAVGNGERQCLPLVARLASGATCQLDVQPNGLRICDGAIGLFCVAGTCAVMTDGRAGSPCEPDFGHCKDGLACFETEGVCGARRDVGGACASGDECLSAVCENASCAPSFCN